MMNPTHIHKVVRDLAERIRSHYVFPALGREVAASLIQRLEDGLYERMDTAGLAKQVSADLLALSDDRHMRLYWTDHDFAANASGGRRAPEENNFGVQKIEHFEGNVRYIELREFYSLAIAESFLEASMKLLSTGRAIVFDLRKNGGGDPAAVNFLFSHFMEPGVEYMTFYGRDGKAEPAMRTRDHLQSPRLLEVPVYILTSSKTFSGGEEFAYNFQAFQRGVIVGETTGGGANPGSLWSLEEGFEIFVPESRPIHMVTQTNWEGVGVIPDEPVDSDLALIRALELIESSKFN